METQKTPPTPEEKAKAERTIWILYGVMVLFVLGPFVVWFIIRK